MQLFGDGLEMLKSNDEFLAGLLDEGDDLLKMLDFDWDLLRELVP